MIVIIITITIILILYIATNYAFKNILLSPRKDKQKAFEVLENRKVYDIKKYESLKIENLEIKSNDNLNLKGYYINNDPNSNHLVILIHGYTGNHYMSFQFVDVYTKCDYNILLIDSRSHGESEGKYPTYGIRETEDIHLWINYIKDKLNKELIIGLHGQSMGAATALIYGGKYNDIDFIIADCPYTSGEDILKYQFRHIVKIPTFPLYNLVNKMISVKCKFKLKDASPINAIKNKDIPALFIHGKADSIIPYTMSQQLYNSKTGDNNKLIIIDKADHVEAYMTDKIAYEEELTQFLKSLNNDMKIF